MRIDRVHAWREELPLTKPYTISRHTVSAVRLFFVRVEAGGLIGAGCASPAADVTGETGKTCQAALELAGEILVGREAHALGSLALLLEENLPSAPAARAALDMALWDLLGQSLGVPVVDLLGRRTDALPTSVTVGIQSTRDAIELARDYLGQGFRVLKVKLGRDLEADIERLRCIRETVGAATVLRTDPNAGYDIAGLRRYLEATRDLDIEFCEQPLPRGAEADLLSLPAADRARLAADESVLDLADAAELSRDPRPYGIFNLKLMKCGGISGARKVAHLAEAGGIDLMWGCNDESRISIAAALHVAFSSSATRYLDLDGSLDLARDLVAGGFLLEDGRLRPVEAPGLGVAWANP